MASAMSHRIFEQMNNLCQFEHPILAIITHNVWKDFYYTKSNYIYQQYIGLLTTITVKYPKIKIMFFDSDEMFIYYIELLHKKLNTEGHKERPVPLMRRAKSFRELQENMLCSAKGISVKSAKRLLSKYNTVENMCSATLEDLESTDKISKTQAENVYKILHTEYNKKNNNKKNGK